MAESRTKRTFAHSLNVLLQKKSLNKITIQDIADESGLNRMTFYYHFKDIYDLIEWICHEEAKKAMDGNMDSHSWQKGLLKLFRIAEENRSFVMNVIRYMSREQMERSLLPTLHSLILQFIQEETDEEDIAEEHLNFLASFYQYAFVGTFLEWIRKDMQEDPEKVVQNMNAVVQGTICPAILHFKELDSK